MGFMDLNIDVGGMRHRVDLQSPGSMRDDYGQEGPAGWPTQATQWAKITPLSGREYVNAEQVKPQMTHAVEMRYNPEITVTTKWRAVYGARVFQIGAVIDVQERHVKTVLLCTETPAT